MTHRKLFLLLGGALVVLVGIVLLLLVSPSETGLSNGPKRAPVTVDPTLEFTAGGSQDRIPPEEVLVHYRQWAVFPPDSRPLLPSHTDVLNYKEVHLPPQGMPAVVDGVARRSDYSCRLQPLEHTVYEGGSMRVLFYCLAGKERVAVRITGFELRKRLLDEGTVTQGMTLASPGSADAAGAGSHGQVFVFRPQNRDWGTMFLSVKFTIPGDKHRADYELKTSFFSSPVAPARFTGQFEEDLRDGSLYVKAQLMVKKPGRYTIEANLMAEGRPVAFARRDIRFGNSGLQWVELEYFGKIFHERSSDGPYQLVGLRGLRHNTAIDPDRLSGSPEEVEKYIQSARTTEPERQYIVPYEKTYVTRPYRVADFEDREYDSPLKRERIRLIEGLIRKNR